MSARSFRPGSAQVNGTGRGSKCSGRATEGSRSPSEKRSVERSTEPHPSPCPIATQGPTHLSESTRWKLGGKDDGIADRRNTPQRAINLGDAWRYGCGWGDMDRNRLATTRFLHS